jgi:hypothetical protein
MGQLTENEMALCRQNLRVLTAVVSGEERLQVREMEAAALLLRFGKIKGRARLFVVQVPARSMIVPVHPALELLLNVKTEVIKRTSKELEGWGGFYLTFQDAVNAGPEKS